MSRHDGMMEAARTISDILFRYYIEHAYIGGFALNMLGSDRETSDIDIQIDVSRPSVIRTQIIPFLCGADSRFVVEDHKLYFGPSRIPIEMLTSGMLNLPPSRFPGAIPLLHPGVLILTKIKRATQYIGSTRPQSIFKCDADVRDIVHLLHWLPDNDEKIDFDGYDASDPGRLYRAVRIMRAHWVSTGQKYIARMLEEALQESDRTIVLDEDVREMMSQMPVLSM